MINQQISWIRRIILFLLIGVFLILSGLFYKQLQQNNRVEKSLETAYSYSLSHSKGIENLYHAFNEADMTFRMFTLNFDQKLYTEYHSKMTSVYGIIDSLNKSIDEEEDEAKTVIDFSLRNRYLQEFTSLRFALDSLLLHSELTNQEIRKQERLHKRKIRQTDSVIRDIIQENIITGEQDTVFTKRERLLKRIFNPTQDTIIIPNKGLEKTHERLIGIVQDEDSVAQAKQQIPNDKELGNIRSTIRRLQAKEEQLIINTNEILHSIKENIDRLRHLEVSDMRRIESKDFEIYRKNAQDINRQFILGLTIMGLLIIILLYHQWNTQRMEKKLMNEVQYSNNIAKEKTEVLASISHEVRTPLNSLLHLSKILKNNPSIQENRENKILIDSIFDNIESTSNTINDILMLSRLEEKNNTLTSNPDNWHYFNVESCLQSIVDLNQNQADLKSIILSSEISGIENLSIKSDPFPIKQALTNFVSNAIQHTQLGGTVKIKAEFSTQSSDQKNLLMLQVEDNGAGIPKENHDNIFRKYFTSRNTTGFGLGLYISQKLIEGINGIIGFVSEVNKGSTFYIQIPIQEFKFNNQAMDDHIATNTKAIDLDTIPILNILSVDDNAINLMFVRHFFKNTPHNMVEAASIAQAKSLLLNSKIDLVITDINLPDGSGWDLLDLIQEENSLKDIKIIATSASREALEASHPNSKTVAGINNKKHTFDGILPKPFGELELWSTLRAVVEKQG